ncbi:MAG TPA: TonB family protein [Pyrinomonadaceae bacterium]|jgi:TonB family protein|nr:TonB family protein [Pyrinomonadaceae bacterium]
MLRSVLLAAGLIASVATFSGAQLSHRPIVISSPLPGYPPIAAIKKERGKILIDVKIDSSGKVVSAAVVKGPSILSKVALEKALEWRFNEAANGTGLRPARLTFVFHRGCMAKPRFTPPYRVDIVWCPTG